MGKDLERWARKEKGLGTLNPKSVWWQPAFLQREFPLNKHAPSTARLSQLEIRKRGNEEPEKAEDTGLEVWVAVGRVSSD